MALSTDLKTCLKAIEEGNFKSINISVFIKKFQDDPVKLGDHLQFALHKFCKKNENQEIEESVIKLSQLCFSKESARGFNNMDRFLGSLFHISTYFINKNLFSIALEISKSVEFKKTNIEKCALEHNVTRQFLYMLHSTFLSAAQKIAAAAKTGNNEEMMMLSFDMAQMSIYFLNLIKLKQLELGRKLFRNFNGYLHSLKYFDRKRLYELYSETENSLNNLMPMYTSNDFLLYYISKMEQAKDITEMEYQDLNCHFKKHLNIITALINDSKTMKYWDLVFLGNPENEVYFKDFFTLISKITLHKNSKLYLLTFSIIFNYIAQLWIRKYTDNWNEVISTKIVQKLYSEVLLPMKNSLGNVSDYCRPIEYQLDICFSDFYVMNFLKILHMIRLSLKFNAPNCLDLVTISRKSFQIVREQLNKMKNQCCSYRKKQCWNNLIFHCTNTIEGILRHSTASNSWEHMKNCAEELLCEIINSEFEIPYEWKRVKILFQRWHYGCLKLKDYKEALFVCTFYVVSFPQEEEEALSMWTQTKLDMNGEVSESLTFKDIIDGEEEKIKRMNRKYETLKPDLKRLLMKELMAYSSNSASNIASSSIVRSIIKLWEILKDMELKLWERAAALNLVIGATISVADSDSIKKYKKECENVINIITDSRKKRDCRSLLYAGNLKYSLFLCQLKSIQEKEDKINCSHSVLEYLKKEEEEKVKFGETVDMNLTCNVMPSSNHFTITFEENYLNALNETFALWQEVVEKVSSTCLEFYEFNTWLHNVKQIAHMYYLIGDVYQSFLSWLLYYRISKICNNRTAILLGLSQIIPEYSNLENSEVLKEAEEIADDLSVSNKEREILVIYWLSVASNYLKNKNAGRCFNYLCKIKNVMYSVRTTTRLYTFQARYWCLVSKFLCLYHDYLEMFGLRPHTELRTVVFKAFSYANAAVKDGSISSLRSSECNEILLTMLEVNVWASRFFGVYYQASFMRFFLDDLYQIFQKLVLPTRTAYILMLLAEIDVMCEKTEDGNTKLNSLKSILGTSALPRGEHEEIKPKKSGLLKVPTIAEEERESPRAPSPARFLNVHDSSRERDPSPLRFVLNDVDLVKRLDHSARCTCYACRNLLIKLIYVNILLLEARLHQMNGLIKKSCSHYKEGYKNLKKLELYQLEQNEKLFGVISKTVTSASGVLDFHCELVKVNSIKFLTNYALFMLSPALKENMLDDVYKIIVRIDKIMTGLSYEPKLLQWQVTELKLMTFAIHGLRTEENQRKQVEAPPERQSSSPKPWKTPLVTKLPGKNAAPMKYKKTKCVKSPNSFVSKPSGRKVFSDDEEKPVDKPEVKTDTRKKAERGGGESKRNLRKKVHAMMDVELLS